MVIPAAVSHTLTERKHNAIMCGAICYSLTLLRAVVDGKCC
jgi:hypothetical protein